MQATQPCTKTACHYAAYLLCSLLVMQLTCYAAYLLCSLLIMQLTCYAAYLLCSLLVMQLTCYAAYLLCSLLVMQLTCYAAYLLYSLLVMQLTSYAAYLLCTGWLVFYPLNTLHITRYFKFNKFYSSINFGCGNFWQIFMLICQLLPPKFSSSYMIKSP